LGDWVFILDQGIALVFGPVLNPSAPHGLAIIEVENLEQVPKLIAENPAVLAGIMTSEFYPMKAIIKNNIIPLLWGCLRFLF